MPERTTHGSLSLLPGFYRYLFSNDAHFGKLLELTIVKAFLFFEILAQGNIAVVEFD